MSSEFTPELLRPSYMEVLRIGMENLQRYSLPENHSYIAAEVDHLHNIPSYYNEANIHRHFYYFCSEKSFYVEQLRSLKTELEIEWLLKCYEPHWLRIRETLQPYSGVLNERDRLLWNG